MKVTECTKRPILSPCGLEDFNYQIDTYIGCEHYCYYCYVLPQAETDWSKEIYIHKDLINQLSREIDKILPQKIYMGYNSDPYQPCESKYLQTRKTLDFLLERDFSVSILTKSDLVCRDIDILKKMKESAVSVSIAFHDNKTRRLFEANTIDTEDRIDALRQLKEAGIQTGVLVCPVIPYITDAIQLVEMVQPYSDKIWIYGLSINDRQDQNWLNIVGILYDHFPDLTDRIEPIIFSKDHNYWVQQTESLEALRLERQLNLDIHI
jgi:DNA repair photolyase